MYCSLTLLRQSYNGLGEQEDHAMPPSGYSTTRVCHWSRTAVNDTHVALHGSMQQMSEEALCYIPYWKQKAFFDPKFNVVQQKTTALHSVEAMAQMSLVQFSRLPMPYSQHVQRKQPCETSFDTGR